MKEYVWMFGSLSASDEAAYCYQMTGTSTINLIAPQQQQRLSQCIVNSISQFLHDGNVLIVKIIYIKKTVCSSS